MRILALDQSTRVSGWAFFDENKLISFGHWTNAHEDLAVRIFNLCEQIKSKIIELKPDLIVIENIQLEHGNVQTFQKLAQVQGAIMFLVASFNIKYEFVYPSEWRKSCQFLKGNAKDRDNQKKIAQSWVQETYNKKCTQDEADAICIGYSKMKEQSFICF